MKDLIEYRNSILEFFRVSDQDQFQNFKSFKEFQIKINFKSFKEFPIKVNFKSFKEFQIKVNFKSFKEFRSR